MGEYKKGNTISRGSVTGHIHVHTYILSYHIIDWSIASHHIMLTHRSTLTSCHSSELIEAIH